MRSQIVLFVVVTSSRRNLAPTNGFNNIFNLDIFKQILYFVIMFNFCTTSPARMRIDLPKIHQNLQQQKFDQFSESHSRSRGVAKVTFRLPMLHGDRFLFCFPCSMGMRKPTFATPPQRECDFFHFCHTSPARSSKLMKMPFSNHCFGVISLTTRTSNRH